MKVESNTILTCSVCQVESSHKLLYLSRHLHASECANCRTTKIYSGHLYGGYAKDLTERVVRLPFRLIGEASRSPTAVLRWPAKGLRKPFRLAKEISQVATFEWRVYRRHGT